MTLPMRQTFDEQERFSARLVDALHRAGRTTTGPTALASEFNARFPQHAVSVHAARKWVKGESIPTQERIIDLAGWLGVTPSWLRFGGDDEFSSEMRPEDFLASDLHTLRAIQCLDNSGKEIVNLLIRVLLLKKIG
ncbi:transcriptional regulator with XRE-family HTH domain [Actimicrobium sp. GrIS 1.19]|uniref:hypothetical protein n=1 Tax=Actimicrobium sp. GrIS 1.19 TaxID=3071708 RepID=UPI002E04AE44|nr:transcriptional regulator with XRE-family HTH domain [Actimicrobium sp. GrIS 1.19]